jgi:hypothetical protein
LADSASRRRQWYHLRVRLAADWVSELRQLAVRRRSSVSELVRSLLLRELNLEASGAGPDESAIREMAILIAVELVLKLQEASIPGGVTLSRRLLEDAARAAISRIELVEQQLQREAGQ